MTARAYLACLAAIALLVVGLAQAEHTREWRQSDAAEFEKGTAKGVAIRSDGKLMPAPRFSDFCDPNLAYLWALRLDSKGQLYAAGGSDAKVLRVDANGKSTTVFESSELAAQAIVFDSHDNLYVGTSPDGKVYRATSEGQKSVFFDPKTKYIWALAMDSQGALYVATGDKGQVFVVTPDGNGRLFYQSDERHARSLAFDAKGNLLIGTEPNGLILRIEIRRKSAKEFPEAGSSFVLYETSKKEVTSLITDSNGNIFASSIGDKPRAPLVPSGVAPVTVAPQPQAANSIQAGNVTTAPVAQVIPPIPYLPSPTGGAEVIEILSDGSPNSVWTSREDLVYSLGYSAAGKVLLGTGNKGTIVQLEGNNVHSTIARTSSGQVTSLLAGPEGKIFVASANPGKIFVFGPGLEREGSFESETFDAKNFSHWGRLTWWGESGATAGKVEFYARSGNTSRPEKNWSPWAGPYKMGSGETVNCPPARFAQWKAVFLETDGAAAPNISWVSLAYLPKNVAPVIDDIVIQDAGIRVQGFMQPAGGPGVLTPVQLKMPQRLSGTTPAFAGFAAPASSGPEIAARPLKAEIPPQGFEDKGYQSVLWSAHDDNDDDLTFSVFYRGEGEQNWRLLKDKISQKFYTWDTTTMPDSAYYLKITASDAPSNPPDQALTAERVSERFVIANTPPKIDNLHASPEASSAKVSFDGISSSGAITRAQYSLDAGDWLIVFPNGLLSDAPRENYQINLAGLSSGEHTLAVQVSDRFGNSTAAKVTFTISGHASN
jgi:hypothetical protein